MNGFVIPVRFIGTGWSCLYQWDTVGTVEVVASSITPRFYMLVKLHLSVGNVLAINLISITFLLESKIG